MSENQQVRLHLNSQFTADGNSTASASDVKPKKKICCACPDTKRLRDECVVEHGEDACTKWVEATSSAFVPKGLVFRNIFTE